MFASGIYVLRHPMQIRGPEVYSLHIYLYIHYELVEYDFLHRIRRNRRNKTHLGHECLCTALLLSDAKAPRSLSDLLALGNFNSSFLLLAFCLSLFP